MDLVQWRNDLPDPFFQGFEELQDEINKLFDLTRPLEPRGIFERTFSPAMDVVEHGDSYSIVCDLPGVDLKDIEITMANAVLTIKGEKKRSEQTNGARTYREDAAYGKFQRTIRLPLPVEEERIEAVMKDGVLRITLPKREEVKPRQITVKAK